MLFIYEHGKVSCSFKKISSSLDTDIYVYGKPYLNNNQVYDYSSEALKKQITRNQSYSEIFAGIDGAFLIILHKKNENKIIFANDVLGMYGAFYLVIDNKVIISHCQSELAKFDEANELDKSAIAYFLRTGSLGPGQSYHQNVSSMDFATIIEIDLQSFDLETRQYYDPSEVAKRKYESITESTKNLESAFALHARSLSCHITPTILMSGGMDSRLVASYFTPECSGVTLSTFENRELNITRKIAKKLEIELEELPRTQTHYLDNLVNSVMLSGGISTYTQNHYGSKEIINKLKVKNSLLSGCYFDYFFKGLASDTASMKFFGLDLGIKKLAPTTLDYYIRSVGINANYQGAIDLRRSERTFSCSDANILEMLRVCPLYLEHDSLMRMQLQQLDNWHLFIANRKIIETFLKIPVKDKLNSKLIRNLINQKNAISSIKNSNTDTYIRRSIFIENLERFIKKIKRILFIKVTSNELVENGSWFSDKFHVTNGEFRNRILKASSETQAIINDVLGVDLFANVRQSNKISDLDAKLLIRALTISIYLDEVRKR